MIITISISSSIVLYLLLCVGVCGGVCVRVSINDCNNDTVEPKKNTLEFFVIKNVITFDLTKYKIFSDFESYSYHF